MFQWTKYDFFKLVLPAVSGFATGAIVGVKDDAGSTIKARPPAWFFGFAWSILYILLGLSWVLNKKDTKLDVLYYTLIFLLCSWIVVYKKSKRYALYIIVLSILVTLLIMINSDITSKNMLAPLIVWLLFASMLNYTEVNNKE